MAHLISTNPYGQYHASNSKEYMALRDSGLNKWQPDQTFSLKPENCSNFCNQIRDAGQTLCFLGMISRFPTQCTINRDDPANVTYTYGEHRDMLETYGQVSQDHVQKSASMIWGDKSYTVVANKEIQNPTSARGELTVNGAALTANGKKLMLARFQRELLGNACLKSLDEAGRRAVMLEKSKFQWFHPTTGELVNDGPTVLQIILHKFRPNVMMIAFNEIRQIKTIQPSDYEFKIDEWDTAMEAKRVDIETKVPNEYSDNAFINDYFNLALTVPVKSFKTDVASMKQRWQLGEAMTITFVRTTICQMHTNLSSDEANTWATELAETSQIIALCSKIDDLEAKLAQNTIALATATSTNGNQGGGSSNRRSQRDRNGKKGGWLVEYAGDTITKNGTEYTFCREEHWLNGEKVQSMYHTHKKGQHDAWKKASDERYAKRQAARQRSQQGSQQVPPGSETVVNDETKKKLALSEKLRTALTTQAGLSNDAFNRIWAECERESGKE